MKRFVIHLIPALVAVLLLLLDFKCSGRLGMVNKPFVAALVAVATGVVTGLGFDAIPRKLASIILYALLHLGVSIFVIVLFFKTFLKDSL